MKYKINKDTNTISIQITPSISKKQIVYSLERKSPEESPIQFFTATTDMRDWIGNVRKIYSHKNDKLLSVEGIYRGKKKILKNIKSRDNINKIGERVMVTEHLNVAGGFDMLATKFRILDLTKPELSFINIGWKNKNSYRFLRIDPYTGEVKECVVNAATQ